MLLNIYYTLWVEEWKDAVQLVRTATFCHQPGRLWSLQMSKAVVCLDLSLLQVFGRRLEAATDPALADTHTTLFWCDGNSVCTTLQNMCLCSSGTEPLCFYIVKQPLLNKWRLWKSQEALGWFVFADCINSFSPENVGCCEHDLQFHRIKVVFPVKLSALPCQNSTGTSATGMAPGGSRFIGECHVTYTVQNCDS